MPFPQLVPEPFRSAISLVVAPTDPAFTLRLTPKSAGLGRVLPSASRRNEAVTEWGLPSPPQPAKEMADRILPALQDDLAGAAEVHKGPDGRRAESARVTIQAGEDSRLAAPNSILRPAGNTDTKSDNPLAAPDRIEKESGPQESPRQAPRRSLFWESETTQREAKDAKPEPVARPEVQVQSHGANVEAVPFVQPPAPVVRTEDIQVARRPALGTSPPKLATDPEIKAPVAPLPARQISLKLSGDSTRVNVEVSERAGKIQVSVRTPDHELTRSLQTELGELVGRLESKGFKTETWIPPATHGASPPQGVDSGSATGQEQSGHSGPGSGNGGQRQGQNDSNQRQQARWTAELERTLSAKEKRSESQ